MALNVRNKGTFNRLVLEAKLLRTPLNQFNGLNSDTINLKFLHMNIYKYIFVFMPIGALICLFCVSLDKKNQSHPWSGEWHWLLKQFNLVKTNYIFLVYL